MDLIQNVLKSYIEIEICIKIKVKLISNFAQREDFLMKKSDILKEIDNIKDQLITKYKPEKVILCGSAARREEEINS